MEETIIPDYSTSKSPIFWHIRVKDNIRQLHPSYRQLSEDAVKLVPDEYWYVDPIHLTKPTLK